MVDLQTCSVRREGVKEREAFRNLPGFLDGRLHESFHSLRQNTGGEQVLEGK